MPLPPRLAILSVLLAIPWFSYHGARADACKGPEALEAKIGAQPTAQRYTALGSYFSARNQSACAAEAYRAALKQDPRFSPALDLLAKSLTASGDALAAIDLLKHVTRDEDLTVDLADAYIKAGAAAEASEVLVRAVKASPASAKLTAALVVLLANNNQLDDAYRLADQLYRRHPQDLDAEKLYLRVLVATNQASAGPLARKLLAAYPHDGEVLYRNAVLEQKAGQYAVARDHFQQAVALAPDYADARYNLGIVLARLQDPAGAKKQLQRAIELGATDTEAHLELSKVLRTLGESEAADNQLKLYQQVIRASTNRTMAESKSADAQQALDKGDAGKAVALYREALEATPQDGLLRYKLALALDRSGDETGERTALEQAVEIDPNLALAQHQLGYLLYKGGDYDAAERHFRLALHSDPSFTQAWISLAATLATRSRFIEAQDAVSHALRLDPRNAQALLMKKELPASR